MVTKALAMLAAAGGSHCTSVTAEGSVLPAGPPNACVELDIRTGRYVVGFTYRVHRARTHRSRTALASPVGSLTVTGVPVIFVVSTPLIRTCPVMVAAPQASIALMRSDH